ncbi:hypothetical protein BDV26DRAFT_298439 [Aspergillus bertholletiae]|uniref:FAD/NAD(P)-binding domain-containing protein n=1 Tax=Aspergillus bertholletiae TaxID=1226010 RepID=A0A5N7AR87_9EURO|nr:hypothetical protein BDV26DRAFT_298439 [Aspergillus bertholletiae]
MLSSLRQHAMTGHQPHVAIIGGSYAGVSAVQNMLGLLQGRGIRPSPIPQRVPELLPDIKPRITILDRRDGFFHTMGSPLALTSRTYAEKAWQAYRDLPSFTNGGVNVVHGEATNVNMKDKIITYDSQGTECGDARQEMPYDYLIVTTGLGRTWPIAPVHSKKYEYLGHVERYSQELNKTKGPIIVVGGGAVGVEMAAEIAVACPSKKVILVHSRLELLSSEPLSSEYKQKVQKLLSTNVEVHLGGRVARQETISSDADKPTERLTLLTGEVLDAGKVIWCGTKPAPNTQFLPADCLNGEGYVKVKSDLSFASDAPNSGDHFAAGDIAAWDGMKSVGGALLMGQCAAINIIGQLGMATQQGKGGHFVPAELPPFPLMMALAVGGEAASVDMSGSVDSGRHIQEMFFGNDLALTKTRELLGLSGEE